LPTANRAKNWLIANGVTFMARLRHLLVKSSRLIVRNTQDQLDLVDSIISAAEMRFHPKLRSNPSLSNPANNLKELTFTGLLGRSILPATKNAFASAALLGLHRSLIRPNYPFVAPGIGRSAPTRSRPQPQRQSRNQCQCHRRIAVPGHGHIAIAPAIGPLPVSFPIRSSSWSSAP